MYCVKLQNVEIKEAFWKNNGREKEKTSSTKNDRITKIENAKPKIEKGSCENYRKILEFDSSQERADEEESVLV